MSWQAKQAIENYHFSCQVSHKLALLGELAHHLLLPQHMRACLQAYTCAKQITFILFFFIFELYTKQFIHSTTEYFDY